MWIRWCGGSRRRKGRRQQPACAGPAQRGWQCLSAASRSASTCVVIGRRGGRLGGRVPAWHHAWPAEGVGCGVLGPATLQNGGGTPLLPRIPLSRMGRVSGWGRRQSKRPSVCWREVGVPRDCGKTGWSAGHRSCTLPSLSLLRHCGWVAAAVPSKGG